MQLHLAGDWHGIKHNPAFSGHLPRLTLPKHQGPGASNSPEAVTRKHSLAPELPQPACIAVAAGFAEASCCVAGNCWLVRLPGKATVAYPHLLGNAVGGKLHLKVLTVQQEGDDWVAALSGLWVSADIH